jgi:hypothetical protein
MLAEPGLMSGNVGRRDVGLVTAYIGAKPRNVPTVLEISRLAKLVHLALGYQFGEGLHPKKRFLGGLDKIGICRQ